MEGETWQGTRTDGPLPTKEGTTTGGEERQLIISMPDVKVTFDGYTPFEAHVISILKSIDSRLKRIQEALL